MKMVFSLSTDTVVLNASYTAMNLKNIRDLSNVQPVTDQWKS